MTDLRISHAQEWTVRRLNDGGLALPLQISRGDRLLGMAELRLTPAAAEHLHAALCYALDGQLPPTTAPDCRKEIRYPGRRSG
ncbi:hypothetical protein [Streptomyces botrytidirepellens]|uniref:Uncharacterized protein n=1 Tax=Streptomyces botrytidirepellens TaxID=2486417 RepID=A0A3M8W0W7_9ACTN|nr:hypothetical protein [Streptomyces botrytidirepellens]RNG22409.1 hypothetical protein EEJ42_20580 [Streptomyces botrytidirepellens]